MVHSGSLNFDAKIPFFLHLKKWVVRDKRIIFTVFFLWWKCMVKLLYQWKKGMPSFISHVLSDALNVICVRFETKLFKQLSLLLFKPISAPHGIRNALISFPRFHLFRSLPMPKIYAYPMEFFIICDELISKLNFNKIIINFLAQDEYSRFGNPSIMPRKPLVTFMCIWFLVA